ncbi:MAG: restriction endonuclease subunit S [Azonexus sp.]
MEVREPNARYLVKPGFKQTEVGVIPEDWDCVQLTHVAKLESGHTPSRRHPEYWGGDIPWVSLHDTDSLGGREIYTTSQTITNEGIKHSSARLLPKGTVVFSRTATVGKVTTLGRDMATSQDFANYICGPRVFNYFLVYLFRWMAPEWEKLMAGSTHNSIYMPAFQSLKVILPPRPEQQAIAEALSDADTLIESLEQLLAKKRQIKQGAMQELLTGQKRLAGFAGKWEEKRLGDVADTDPENLSSDTRPDFSFNYISLEDVDQGRLCGYSEQVYCTSPSRARRKLRKNDVLVSTVRPNLQSHLLFLIDEGTWICSTGFCVVRCKDGVSLHAYIYQHLFSGFVNQQIETLLTGSNYPAINSRDVCELLIPVPPIEEQTAIATVLSDLDAELAALETKLTKARQLKQGMMQELLTGRIRLVQPKAEVIAFPAQEANTEKHRAHNPQIEEAVMLGVLANAFGTEKNPLARVRRTKLLYLLHRHIEGRAEGYLKKAAGPYNPKTRYQGGERIAVKNAYVRPLHNGTWEGFVAGDKAVEAEAYFDKWYEPAVRAWLEQFRYTKTEELELLATVDMAVEDLRNAGSLIALDSVKEVIRSHPEWQAKLERAIFSDDNIERAITKCHNLFSN